MRTSRLTQSQTKWSTCSRPSSTGTREPLKMIERYIILSPYQLLSLIDFGIHDCSQPHYWHGFYPFPRCNHWFMLVLDSILSLHVSADEMDLTTHTHTMPPALCQTYPTVEASGLWREGSLERLGRCCGIGGLSWWVPGYVWIYIYILYIYVYILGGGNLDIFNQQLPATKETKNQQLKIIN